MGPNVIVHIPGKSTDLIIIGAHLDSRNNVGSNTDRAAPGADDNGSGSAAALDIARVLSESSTRFHYSIELQWYCGEEQGLLGSKALATEYKSKSKTVIAMYNIDMIGYTYPPDGILLCFDTGSVTTSLRTACENIAASYLPALKRSTNSGCCSDQQSWYNQGFPSMSLFETAGKDVLYPSYHQSSDTIEKVNMLQVYQFTQALLACAAEYAIPL